MNDITRFVIAGVTMLMIIYIIAINVGVSFAIALLLFFLSVTGLILMVYTILKDDYPSSGKTFDKYYYEDSDLQH
jgi:hypothetical protein